MKRWIPLTVLAVCVGLEVLWRWVDPVGRILPRPLAFLGILPIVAGSVLAVLGLWGLRKAHTTVKAFHQPRKLVTGGVYRYTRNPIYLGMALMLVGACMLFGARCVLAPAAIFVLVLDRWIIRAEERSLSRAFGTQFDDYRSRTRRWI